MSVDRVDREMLARRYAERLVEIASLSSRIEQLESENKAIKERMRGVEAAAAKEHRANGRLETIRAKLKHNAADWRKRAKLERKHRRHIESSFRAYQRLPEVVTDAAQLPDFSALHTALRKEIESKGGGG